MKAQIHKASIILIKNKTILYPTDTVWGIGCDATNFDAVSKIYQLKKREESKSLIVLVSSLSMLEKYVEVSEKVKKIIEEAIKPTTIIYKNPIGLAKNVYAKDNSVAIRIVQDDFCKALIEKLEKPIISTSANVSGEPTPISFSEIRKPILESVDYIVNLHQDKINKKSSTIIKVVDNEIQVLRP